jgi:MFS family permease
MGEAFVREHQIGDDEDIRAFRLGALLAQDPNRHAEIEGFNDEERQVLNKEITNKWSQPKLLYLVIILCSTCAAVQGMGEGSPYFFLPGTYIDKLLDETVVNGAQIFYTKQFGIGDKTSDRDSWLTGLVNSAPYLCCAFIGCWLTIPFNNWFGRRGTIFLTCCFSALACFWQAFANTVSLLSSIPFQSASVFVSWFSIQLCFT